MTTNKTFLCISNYFKGEDFLTQLKALGNTVYLVTSEVLRDKPWPRDFIDEIFYMPGQDTDWDLEQLLVGVAGILKSTKIDALVALDDFDVEKATFLRENLRIPGMGQTTGRYFRDKLAMRMRAQFCNIPIPAFCSLFNDEDIHQFTETVPAPWVLKPRSEASASGIVKLYNKEDLWKEINKLGDARIRFLLEQFKPGSVYHCDALNFQGKVLTSVVSKYWNTPLEITSGGGIFRSSNIAYNSEDDKNIKHLNKLVNKAFGMQHGASHGEFIKCNDDGKIYFLETSSRVGGAHLADMVEAATGINMWKEWAKIETCVLLEEDYQLPKPLKNFGGIINTLSKHKHPNYEHFKDPEIVMNIKLDYHAGLVFSSEKKSKIDELMEKYAIILAADSAVGPQKEIKKVH